MIRSIALLFVALFGMAAAWTGGGYSGYDRYTVPMRADQDGYGFGSLFESNRRMFQDSRINTSGEYNRYRGGGMDYYGYGGNGMQGNYGNGRMLQRYRPNGGYGGYGGMGGYGNGYGYDYGYNGRYGGGMGGYGGGYGGYGGYGNNNRYYNNNDYWSYSQSPRNGGGGYGPNYDSYRYY